MTPTQQKVLRNVINTMQKYNLHESVRKQLIKESEEDAATIEQMNQAAVNYIPGQPIPPDLLAKLKSAAQRLKGRIEDMSDKVSDKLHSAFEALGPEGLEQLGDKVKGVVDKIRKDIKRGIRRIKYQATYPLRQRQDQKRRRDLHYRQTAHPRF